MNNSMQSSEGTIDTIKLLEDYDRIMNFHYDSSDEEASNSNSVSILDWNYCNDTIDEQIDKIRAD